MTSIELPPGLYKRARLLATQQGTSFRVLMERALRDFLRREES
jgi:predicted transcriptional regulator